MSSAVVSGTGRFSLGSRIAVQLGLADPHLDVVGIARRPISDEPADKVSFISFDLNPFNEPQGFERWSLRLNDALQLAPEAGVQPPYKYLVLAAASYFVAPYIDHPDEVRRELLGTNVISKFELLFHILQRNARAGIDNARTVTVVDFGSLHSLRGTSHRAFYNSSKAASLALCGVLDAGREVSRSIHIAPGPVDTPMLHWNHWVLKERGDPKLWRHTIEHQSAVYEAVFREGDRDVLERVLESYGGKPTDHLETFERYVHRQRLQRESEDGILDPDVLAMRVVEILRSPNSAPSGIYIFTAPHGRLKERYRAFN